MGKPRLRRFLRLAIFTLALVLVAMLGCLPIGVSYLYINVMVNMGCNTDLPLTQRLSHPVPGLEQFTFSPEAGVTLDAWYLPGSNGAGMVVLPGAFHDANSMYVEVDFLHAAGYSILTYETRSCANPPQKTSLGYTEVTDLKYAVDWLSQRPAVDPQRIGVMGFSMGGATAIMGAAQDPRLKAVVATGNYDDLITDMQNQGPRSHRLLGSWIVFWVGNFYQWQTGVDPQQARPIDVIDQISPRAVFLIHGSREIQDSNGDQQFAAAVEPKYFWLVPGAGHGGYAAAAYEEYKQRVLDFFAEYLGTNHE